MTIHSKPNNLGYKKSTLGRPNGVENLARALEIELSTLVTTRYNGKKIKLSKFAMICRQNVDALARGDFKAAPLFVKLLELTGTKLEAPDALSEELLQTDLSKLSDQELAELHKKLCNSG